MVLSCGAAGNVASIVRDISFFVVCLGFEKCVQVGVTLAIRLRISDDNNDCYFYV